MGSMDGSESKSMGLAMQKWAIVSVYDKQGVEHIAKALHETGYSILSTGGTATYLKEHGIPVHSVSAYTGSPEILDGRVKSLHPKIHGGILCRRDNPSDMQELVAQGISPIDVVVINLYPFSEQSKKSIAARSTESLVEFIDIGGPTMIRGAAKNCEFVLPVSDPRDYLPLAEQIRSGVAVTAEQRRTLAAKVFSMMSAYDSSIASYFGEGERLVDLEGAAIQFPAYWGVQLERVMSLRYGENPHQQAALYRDVASCSSQLWQQTQGKELSYNNLLDMYGTLDLFLELYPARGQEHIAVIIKHSNPCGAAQRPSLLEAFEAARSCDAVSAFGGIVALSGVVDEAVANSITEGFVEVLLATELTEAAAQILARKKNMRVLLCDFAAMAQRRQQPTRLVRNYLDEYLVQGADAQLLSPQQEALVSGPTLDSATLADMDFAWRVCKHVKSNAIVLVKNKTAIGVGAGQMSRVDSARLSVERAKAHGHEVAGSIGASDAFLPFPDTLEILAAAGVVGLVQPGGSIKDDEVIAAAAKAGVSMVFTGERHFRH